MAAYDPSILQKFADDLYTRAKRLELKYGIYGFFISLGGLLLLFNWINRSGHVSSGMMSIWIVILPVVGVVGGIASGREKSFQLKLEAQRTLCQLQMEMNTRRTSQH